MRIFSIASLLALAFPLWAASGSSTFKHLKMSPSPRITGLSQAGSALPSSSQDASTFPAAAAGVDHSWIMGSQMRLTDKLGASYNSLQIVEPLGAGLWKLALGVDFLRVNPLTQRDEDGFATGEFGAGSWNGRIGLSRKIGAWHVGSQFAYTHSTIAEYSGQGIMADVQILVPVRHWLSASVSILHWGWADSYDSEEEITPRTIQSGLAIQLPAWGAFQSRILMDLRQEVESKWEPLYGLEVLYAHLLTLRVGHQAGEGLRYPSAGLGIRVGSLEASYAYAGAPMESELGGNHQFGLALAF